MPHKEITFRALDGANPLGILAALGAFRIATLHDDEATLHWINDGGWRPVVGTQAGEEEYPRQAMAELHRLAGPKACRKRLGDLRKEVEKVEKLLAKKGKKALPPGEAEKRRGDLVRLREEMEDLEKATREGAPIVSDPKYEKPLLPPAHYRDAARRLMETGDPPTRIGDVDLLAAITCDGLPREKDGLLDPTPFSFSNGGSGKCLLKDFRTCAAHATRSSFARLRESPLPREDEVTSLLWDPLDQQSYALRWSDPGNRTKSPPQANATANALAFLGLGFLAVMPVGRRIQATAMDPRARQFTWPIWQPPLDLHTVRSLLAHAATLGRDNTQRAREAKRGIAAVYAARRFFLNKRPFFSPARAL